MIQNIDTTISFKHNELKVTFFNVSKKIKINDIFKSPQLCWLLHLWRRAIHISKNAKFSPQLLHIGHQIMIFYFLCGYNWKHTSDSSSLYEIKCFEQRKLTARLVITTVTNDKILQSVSLVDQLAI